MGRTPRIPEGKGRSPVVSRHLSQLWLGPSLSVRGFIPLVMCDFMKNLASPLLIPLFIVLVSPALGEVIPRSTWPESWFHDPKTASELGITEFHQSPMLDEAVKNGKLPTVEERLPHDPIVVEPLNGIGEYGGTAVVFGTEQGWGEGGMLNAPNMLLIMDPQVHGIHANLARGWEFKDGGKTLTLHLREGMKWSDGHPYTADDFIFWYEHVLKNKELTPVIAREWNLGGKLIEFEKVDDYTVAFHSAAPNPYFINSLAQSYSPEWFTPPSHHLRNYHPDFVPREELLKETERKGFENWMQYYEFMRDLAELEANCPSLQAFIVVKQTPTMLIAERNPYYPKVDPAGNQLPYIDRIEVHYVQNQEMMTAKAATGQATFAGQQTKTSDIPLFKMHEHKGHYRTYVWRRVQGADVAIQFNLNTPREELRGILRDKRFRRALSLAINREEINQIVYYGRGIPRQTTVLPTSKFYEEKFAQAYAQYDPHRAMELLDEMGLIDRDGDGIRERSDGKPLDIVLEWTPMETPKELITELVIDHWRDVGIDIDLKEVSGSLQDTRATGALMDMTLWHADRSTDILFPPEPFWYVPMHIGWETCLWTNWSRWNLTDGDKGAEPSPEAKELFAWWNEMNTTIDEQTRIELGKKILRSQAENLWTVGTVGIAPHPIVVSEKLHNVPESGYWGWDCRWSLPYYPETWYLSR